MELSSIIKTSKSIASSERILLISFTDLLNIFWENHNPTTPNQQGFDIGSQYRSVVFYTSENQKKIAEESILIQELNWKKNIIKII